MGELRIGTSGWVYPHWRERFYPRGLPQARWLEYYARRFPTVEVNNSFYRLPAAAVFAAWRERTPPRFIFAVKASRFITHVKRLRDPAPALARFIERAAHLGDKLGPVLFQLPPRFRLDLERLDRFLQALPRSVRPVMEFRDPSWHVPEVFALLERRGSAYCIMVAPGLVCRPVVTAGTLYVRFHAPGGVRPAFGRRRLARWAGVIRDLMRHAERGWVYFNNDAQGAAIADAHRLADLLDVSPREGGCV
ncbi:MAG TPA: DUF72 domain-containing protein [bacterium]|nr:DUF72 domain-containing protein [bacterium]